MTMAQPISRIDKTWKEVYRCANCDNPFALYIQVHRLGETVSKVAIRAEPLEIPLPPAPPTPCPTLTLSQSTLRTELQEQLGKPRVLKREGEWGTPGALIALYNELTPDDCPAVETLSPARKDKARKYLAIFPEREFWVRAFQEIGRSRLLRGLVKSDGHANFVATFDWLLTKGKDGTENVVKTVEGRYRDGA